MISLLLPRWLKTGKLRQGLNFILQQLRRKCSKKDPAVVIGTGGLSRLFENDKMFDVLLPDLVLIGLEHALVLNGGTSQRWTASTSEVTQ